MSSDAKNWSMIAGLPADNAGRASAEFLDAQLAMFAPRKVMGALREIMAADSTPRAKLDAMTEMVSRALRADSCACFLLRAGGALDLTSSFGVPSNLPYPERLRLGEGVIGDIAARAQPLVIADLQKSPAMTEGLPMRAFCGVPLLRGGRVHGVLLVQNVLPRAYGEEAVEILQTVAMIVAELAVGSGLLGRTDIARGKDSDSQPQHIQGKSFSRGIALGRAVLYAPALPLSDMLAESAGAEQARLRRAMKSMDKSIDRLIKRQPSVAGTETLDILEAYQMFARDRGWLGRIQTAIDKGLTAEAAVCRVQDEARARMSQIGDVYIRQRLDDIEDLGNRLLGHLSRDHAASPAVPRASGADEIILVARTIGPAALLDYDRASLKGVVLERGAHYAHAAIVARSLGIPVVGQCDNIRTLAAAGDSMIVDADQGVVHINPPTHIQDMYARAAEARAARSTLYRNRARLQKCVTRDDAAVSLMMNAGLVSELAPGLSAGAEGVGLFRSELSFMGWTRYPGVDVQADLYGRILDEANGKPVVFRTFDIGGDKPLTYFSAPSHEDNPALGWRAVRIGLDRPAVLRLQFRALLIGARGRDLKIMIPFVSETEEFLRARQFLDVEKARARRLGLPVSSNIQLGAMIEVPSILWQLETLLQAADFVSVGTNDLMQHLYAADRGNAAIRARYDSLSPSMLRALRLIAEQCEAAGKPVTVCGEMAGQPVEAMALIALGFRALSVSPPAAEAIRALVPALDAGALRSCLNQLLATRAHSVREGLVSFACDNNIDIPQLI